MTDVHWRWALFVLQSPFIFSLLRFDLHLSSASTSTSPTSFLFHLNFSEAAFIWSMVFTYIGISASFTLKPATYNKKNGAFFKSFPFFPFLAFRSFWDMVINSRNWDRTVFFRMRLVSTSPCPHRGSKGEKKGAKVHQYLGSKVVEISFWYYLSTYLIA